jgi:peptidoglycan/xylan/chitin deacetylase (PgdA/CDA1 family)
MGPCFFLRDDDACTLDKSFRFFFDAAMERSIPVVYAVIPGRMDKAFIRFMRRAKDKTPHLLDIVQHGWMHTNHSADGTKYEFGASRPLKIQRVDVRLGLERMRSAFDEFFTPAFVPPYHGYDKRTLQVLGEERFSVFSAGTPRLKAYQRCTELPAKISFTDYARGKPYTVNTAAEMMEKLIKSARRAPLSGVLMHHADFTTAASRKELTKFMDYLKVLTAKKDWRILLFSDLGRK